ncbi:hypothetical protein KIPB_009258 [Kipferlia bialata]|uniref:E2 ubiquitin-conjugating enzyme n=1 Tax=Kipferlia bialata TaxID=797122 RepID=A0A9K3D205_9EUKA|nr:hypothetical protein KIPB_009258 [Kipferlia bialata]|eukprot:g9258.t1
MIHGALSRTASQRLVSELRRFEREPVPGVMLVNTDDMRSWRACIMGPSESPYEAGVFELKVEFPKEYPNRPPTCTFITKVFHPNVGDGGSICASVFDSHWSCSYTVQALLLNIRSLLEDPNPNSPLNSDAAQLYMKDRRKYNRRVRKCVREHATP